MRPQVAALTRRDTNKKTRSAMPKRVRVSALAIPGLPPRLQADIKSA
jgi:hypothetical protein